MSTFTFPPVIVAGRDADSAVADAEGTVGVDAIVVGGDGDRTGVDKRKDPALMPLSAAVSSSEPLDKNVRGVRESIVARRRAERTTRDADPALLLIVILRGSHRITVGPQGEIATGNRHRIRAKQGIVARLHRDGECIRPHQRRYGPTGVLVGGVDVVELQLLRAVLTENEAAVCNGEGHDDGRDDGEFEGLGPSTSR